jgi:hypothetical protein
MFVNASKTLSTVKDAPAGQAEAKSACNSEVTSVAFPIDAKSSMVGVFAGRVVVEDDDAVVTMVAETAEEEDVVLFLAISVAIAYPVE